MKILRTTRAKENCPRAVRIYAPSKVRWAARISTSLGGKGSVLDTWMNGGAREPYSSAVRTTERARWRRRWSRSSGWGWMAFIRSSMVASLLLQVVVLNTFVANITCPHSLSATKRTRAFPEDKASDDVLVIRANENDGCCVP